MCVYIYIFKKEIFFIFIYQLKWLLKRKKEYKLGSATLFSILALAFQCKIIPKQYTRSWCIQGKKKKKKEVWSPGGLMLQCKAGWSKRG